MMKKIKKNFVASYKAFLNLKKAHEPLEKIPVRDVFISGLIILLVFSFGAFLGFYKNIYYLIFSINLFLLGVYLLYLVKRELLFKRKYGLNYATYLGLMFDLNLRIFIISILHVFVFIVFFLNTVSIIIILFFLTLSIGSGYLYQLLRSYDYHAFDLPHSEIPYLITWYLVLAVLLSLFTIVMDIAVAYVIYYGFFILIILLKSRVEKPLNKKINRYLKPFVIMQLFMVFVTIIIVILSFDNLTPYNIKNKLSGEAYSVTFKQRERPTYRVYSDLLFEESNTSISVFDKHFNEVIHIDKNEDAAYFVIDGVLHKVMVSDDQEDPIQYFSLASNEYLDAVRFEIYRYEASSFVFIQTIYWLDETLKPEDHFIFIHQDDYILRERNRAETYRLSDLSIEHFIYSLYNPDYDDIVYYKDRNHLFMVYNNRYAFNLPERKNIDYSNGYVAYTNDAPRFGICIDTFEDYIQSEANCGFYSNLETILSGDFYAIDQRFLVHTRGVLKPIDENPLLKPRPMLSNVDYVFILEDSLFIAKENNITINEEDFLQITFYQVNPHDLNEYVIAYRGMTVIILYWMVIWFFIPVKLPKRI
jgi:hypothetical protein